MMWIELYILLAGILVGARLGSIALGAVAGLGDYGVRSSVIVVEGR